MEKQWKNTAPQLAEPQLAAGDMQAIEAIRTRVSIREFTPENVHEEELNTLLDAALCAPSANARRPWHFITVQDKEMLQTLGEIGRYTGPIGRAPLCVVVCGDGNIQTTREFVLEDCAAAIQNLLLAAHALGLGAVWCGVEMGSDMEKQLAELFRTPEKVVPMAMIAIGRPAQTRTAQNRFDTAKLHREKW